MGSQLHKPLLSQYLREHVMCHVHNDYVRQPAQPFRVRKGVADYKNPGTIPKRQSDCFSGFSYTHRREVMEFEN
jgi:hypothetical protein